MFTRNGKGLTAKGVKPICMFQQVFQSLYLFGAFSPITGDHFEVEMPYCNTDTFQAFLNEFSEKSSDEFKIHRNLGYFFQNGFQPIILGKFNTGVGRLSIEIKMRLRLLVIPFLIILFSVLIILLLVLFMGLIHSKSNNSNELFAILFFLSFIYLFSTSLFLLEANSARKLLIKIFDGQIKETS